MNPLVLDCGHVAAEQERLRAGVERWCSFCHCWRLLAAASGELGMQEQNQALNGN